LQESENTAVVRACECGHLRSRPPGVKGSRRGGASAAPRAGLRAQAEACRRLAGTLHVTGPLTCQITMRAILDVIILVLNLYIYVVIAAAIFSWLIAFNVVNARNQAVRVIGEFLYGITEPVLRPIRAFLPSFGGIDISPIVLFIIIILIERVIEYYIYPNVF
jgi:YggT family protein